MGWATLIMCVALLYDDDNVFQDNEEEKQININVMYCSEGVIFVVIYFNIYRSEPFLQNT